MGEMAELFLSSQDDVDFYEECAMNGYRVPEYAINLPLLGRNEGIYRAETHQEAASRQPQQNATSDRVMPTGCWVDKNGEVYVISEMTDLYLNNLIRFLSNNPLLLKQNFKAFGEMIDEKCRRMNKFKR